MWKEYGNESFRIFKRLFYLINGIWKIGRFPPMRPKFTINRIYLPKWLFLHHETLWSHPDCLHPSTLASRGFCETQLRWCFRRKYWGHLVSRYFLRLPAQYQNPHTTNCGHASNNEAKLTSLEMLETILILRGGESVLRLILNFMPIILYSFKLGIHLNERNH